MRIGIRKKIMGSFLIGAALFVITVGVGLVRMKEYLGIINDLIKISERVEMEGDLLLHMDRALMPPNDYLITGDIAERDRFDNSIIRIRGILDKLIEGERDAGQLEVIKRVQEKAIRFADVAIEILYLDDPVGNKEGARMMEEMDHLVEEAIEEARGFYSFDRDKVMEMERLAREKLETTALFFSVALIFAFISLPLLYIYLSRYVTGPILALHRAADIIGGGRLDQRVTIRTGDELEGLGNGFNSMAAALQESKKELDRNMLELYTLYNVSKVLNTTFETEQLLNRIVDNIRANLGIKIVMIMLLDERRQEFYSVSGTDFKGKGKIRRKFGQGFFGLVAQTGMARLVRDVDEEINFPPEDRFTPDIRSIIAIPFGRRGKVLGLLCAFKERPEMFEQHDFELFRAVAEHVAVALENARLYRETKIQAITDGLTGLFNHRYFRERMQIELERADRYGRNLSLIMSDIDNFKNYNDAHGHQMGDDLLEQMAELMRRIIRESDIACRYGGEEFVIIVPESDKKAAAALAERMRKVMEDHPFPYRETQPLKAVTVSIGVATYPVDGKDMEELIRKADDALYRAKREGKNRTVTA